MTSPTELTAMLRIKFEKFSEGGETFWQFRCRHPITGAGYGWQIKRRSVELIKHPGSRNHQRTRVAWEILIARRRLRDPLRTEF
jgi:hypothetical protein